MGKATFSAYAQQCVYDMLFLSGPTWTVPVIYMGVIRLEADGKFFEPVGKRDYKRVLWVGKKSFLPGRIYNANKIEFRVREDWGRMSAYAFFDAEHGGNMLMKSPMKRAMTIEEDTIIVIEPGKFGINYGTGESQ